MPWPIAFPTVLGSVINAGVSGLRLTGAIAAGSAIGQTVSAYYGATLEATRRDAIYRSNYNMPNLVPEVADVIRLYHQGMMDYRGLRAWLRNLGVAEGAEATPRYSALASMWSRVIQSHRPSVPLDLLRLIHFRGPRPAGWNTREELDRHGLARGERGEAYLRPPTPPDIPLIVRLFWQGEVTEADANGMLQAIGYGRADDRRRILYTTAPYPWQIAYQMLGMGAINFAEFSKHMRAGGYTKQEDVDRLAVAANPLTLYDSLTLLNRGKLNPVDWQRYTQALGYKSPEQDAYLRELARQIPGYSDLVAMKVREVWDNAVVQAFGYDDEYNEQDAYVRYMTAQGMGWDIRQQGDPAGGPDTWARAYWRMHWRQLAPSLAFTMLHRLRGDPGNAATWRVPGVTPFTMDDVRLVLKINDYPPAFRDRLAAISFSLIGLRQYRQITDLVVQRSGFGAEAIGGNAFAQGDAIEAAGDIQGARFARARAFQPELTERYMDRGLERANAALLAQSDLQRAIDKGIEREDERINRLTKRYIADTLKRYRTGLVDRAGARAILAAAGWGDRSIALALASEDAAANEQLARAGIARVRSDWMGARTDDARAKQRLLNLGLTEPAADWYLARWRAARGPWARTLTAGQIISALAQGIISTPVAYKGLKDLGYPYPDDIVLLAGGILRLGKAEAASARANQMAREKAARELERQVSKADALKRRMQADIRRLTPINMLKNSYASGRIGEQYFVNRLVAMGETGDAIQLELADAKDRAAKQEGKRRHRKHTHTELTTPGGATTITEDTQTTEQVTPAETEIDRVIDERTE